MSTASEVAMTVIEPGGRRWAQLLDVGWTVRDLLPLILSRLDLPDQIDYDLRHVRSDRVLKPGDTLQGIGIAAGEELQIAPVRNKFLYDLLNKLYDEAVGYVAKQLWGQAESRLETIRRLDPEYPDPKGIWPAVAARTAAAAAAASGPSVYGKGEPAAPASSGQPGYAKGEPVAPPTYTPPPPGSSPPTAAAAQLPKAPAKPRSACAVLAILLGGILLLGLIVIAAGFAWFTLRSPEEESTGGGTIPTIEGEPVLGTGDVQITLRWDNSADLDLHVIDPSGEEIWFLSPTSTSGGQLDVDANGTCGNDPAVENIYWPAGGAPTGNFQVSAVYYGSCDSSGPANYDVTVLIDGQIVDVQSGTLAAEGESSLIGDYQR